MEAVALKERFPDHDEWFYELGIKIDPNAATGAWVPRGMRMITEYKFGNQFAYRKEDSYHRGRWCYSSVRDKIAADVATVLGVNVPCTLLFNNPQNNIQGCIQKAPPSQSHQTLGMIAKACQAICESEHLSDQEKNERISRVVSKIANAYEPINAYFDVWMGNVDRLGLNNTLFSETSSVGTIWLIDFNCGLSHSQRPWTQERFRTCGFEKISELLPSLICNEKNVLQKLVNDAERIDERIKAVDDDVISFICERASRFFADMPKDEANSIKDGLIYRKSHVKKWMMEILAA